MLRNRASVVSLVTAMFLLCCLVRRDATAASPADYISNFSKLATARSETLAIMGGDGAASGGTYHFYDDGTTLNIYKLGGRGAWGDGFRIGDSEVTWQPRLGGEIGVINGDNEFKDNPVLTGNTERFATTALGFETGVQLNISKELQVGAMLGMIYAHSESTFNAGTALGGQLKQQYAGQLFDWDIDTVSLVPSIDLQYQWLINRDVKLTLLSRFAWFKTWSVASSSAYLRGSGNSFDFENRADLDLRLPITLFGFPLHTGGYVALDLLGDNFRDTVGTSTMYTVNSRLVLGDLDRLWKLHWLGIGVSYIAAKTFYGYSLGLEARLQF